MRAFGVLLPMAILTAPLQCNAQALIRLSPHISIEAIRSLDISQIWNSTKINVSEGRNATVEFRMFDGENRPRRDGLYGCGWLLIGTGDVGSQPVGVRIWSDRKCNLLVSPTKDARSDADERFTLSVGSSEVFEIQVNAGSSVSIAGHAVGVIK